MNVAWGITGAGHFLKACIELISELDQVDVFLSRAGEEVLRMYHLDSGLHQVSGAVMRDTLSSAPVVGRFSRSRYQVLVVAPATSNTVAKMVHGISDSMITNLFAQAGKNQVPAVVLPTDLAPEMDTPTPRGKIIKVYPRAIDLANTERLRAMPGVTVVQDVQGLRECLNTFS